MSSLQKVDPVVLRSLKTSRKCGPGLLFYLISRAYSLFSRLDPLTHIHLSFVNFGDDFELLHEHLDWIKRMVHRKLEYPNVRMNIAIGGWAFNDPPTQHLFTDMANYYNNR